MAVGWFSKLFDVGKKLLPAIPKVLSVAPKVIEQSQNLLKEMNVGEGSKIFKNMTKVRRGLETMSPIISRLTGGGSRF